MIDELVYPKDISTEMLFSLFEQAYFPCELDGDGDLIVNETAPTLVKPSADGTQIYLHTGFRGTDGKTIDEKADIVNELNGRIRMLRAVVEDNADGSITLDYLLNIDGGTTKANIVRTVRLFATLVAMLATAPDLQGIMALAAQITSNCKRRFGAAERRNSMGDLVPISKQELAINEERELARIGSVIDNRRRYFEKTYVPHPRFFDAQGYIRALNALEPLLSERAERELLVQGVETIERLACGFGLAGRGEDNARSEVNKTPAEIQLEELRRLRREAQKLVELQQRSWEELNWWVYCGSDCVYPDLCIPKRETISTGCILHRLTRLSEASIWRRMLSWERLETVIDPDVLEEIRSSDFYDSSHEPYFERIRREKHERIPVHIRRHGREGR